MTEKEAATYGLNQGSLDAFVKMHGYSGSTNIDDVNHPAHLAYRKFLEKEPEFNALPKVKAIFLVGWLAGRGLEKQNAQ